MKVEEVVGKGILGYSFIIYVLNDGGKNFEAQLVSTELIQVRANNLDEVKQFFGELLFKAVEIN